LVVEGAIEVPDFGGNGGDDVLIFCLCKDASFESSSQSQSLVDELVASDFAQVYFALVSIVEAMEFLLVILDDGGDQRAT